MEEIVLDARDVKAAYDAAAKKAAQYKDNTGASYPNTERGHFVGRLGEEAAYRWLMKHHYQAVANFVNGDRGADILLRTGLTIEVKSFQAGQFDRWGRCVSMKQLPRVLTKDTIIWMSVGVDSYQLYDWVPCWVMGWNWTDDLQNARPTFDQFQNVQLDPHLLRHESGFPKRAPQPWEITQTEAAR